MSSLDRRQLLKAMGSVLANAVSDALRARLFELPMTPERIRDAMARFPQRSY
jgi:hypothetical protein